MLYKPESNYIHPQWESLWENQSQVEVANLVPFNAPWGRFQEVIWFLYNRNSKNGTRAIFGIRLYNRSENAETHSAQPTLKPDSIRT